ncbi:MAG TPA: hypothetical protein VFG25_05025, partial [Nitrosopumilaceae archaeon]|nr:hypothetical protein [Nitrosopumilaceae archaeon]
MVSDVIDVEKMIETDPLEVFLYGLKSPLTKDRYKHRLGNFFEFLKYSGDLSTQSKSFIADYNKKGQRWLTATVMKFLTFHKDRAERGEISSATIRNYYKPIKAFMEMNEIELPWKKLSRGLPRGRRYATDRAPTLEEIQKLIEYPDRRIKTIVLVMCSSGIRLGAWDYLKWKHVTPIEQDSKVVAAKLVVYAD